MQLQAAGIEHHSELLDYTTPYRDLLELPSLILSQCCGPDLFQDYASNIVPFAAPVISAYEVAPGYYFSHIVKKESAELSFSRVVINNKTSHSGCTAVKLWLSARGIKNYSVYESGSHRNSVRELQEGRADVAAIDALSWRYIDTRGIQILDNSEAALAPPFIAGADSTIPLDMLRPMLGNALKQYGSALGITGLVPVSKGDYQAY